MPASRIAGDAPQLRHAHRVLGTVIFPAMMSALQRARRVARTLSGISALLFVVDVAHAVLGEPEHVDAALERARRLHARDHVEHRDVDALHHGREHATRRLAYWSASTPIASLSVCRAASNTPSPVEPEAW